MMGQVREARKGEAINPFDDWEEFLSEMDCAFGDPNPEDTAQTKLRRIIQGNRTAERYVIQFQTYKLRLVLTKRL